MKWCRDQKTEDLLNKLGVKFEFREVKVADLKIQESKANNARLGQPINAETSESYAVGMLNNATFPAIICSSSHFILDGNHRTDAAVSCGEETVMAYVVMNADRAMMDTIIRTCNTTHGLPLSKDEKLVHAAQLHLSGKRTVADASRMMGLRYNEVRDAVDVMKLRSQLEDMGVQSSSLHKSAVVKLKNVAHHPAVLEQTAALIINEKLTVAEVDSLLACVTDSRTESSRLGILSEWRSRIIGRRDKGVQFPDRTRLFRQLNALDSLFNSDSPIQSLDSIGIRTVEDRQEVQRVWKRIKARIEPMLAEARKQK